MSDTLRDALAALVHHVEASTCQHENTHRGGFIWTICDDCSRKWADDQGGFKPYEDSKPLADARAALAKPAGGDTLRDALQKIEAWELPATGQFWPSGNPVGYEAEYGSNGARDYIRGLARAALAAAEQPAAPDGLKLVPTTPNWDMRNEGREMLIDTGEVKQYEATAVAVWRAMLNAAPDRAPPGTAQPGAVPTWISVEDQRPEKGVSVLVWVNKPNWQKTPLAMIDEWGYLHEAPVSFSSATICVGEGWQDHEFEEVSHWMPLPAPPGAAPLPAVPQPAGLDEQTAFEEWASGKGFCIWRDESEKYERYHRATTRFAREGWEAALAWAATPPQPDASAEPLIPLSAALAAVPPGSWCDPQRVADDLRAIAAAPQADAADAALTRDAVRYRWLRSRPAGPLNGSEFAVGLCIDTWDEEGVGYQLVGEKADAAIDAALSAPTEPAKGDAL